MMCDIRFFICEHCGNLIGMIDDSGIPIECCGEPMKELIANTVDASYEKHTPAVSVVEGLVSVNVGSAPHPMLPEHYIEWIYLKTNSGGYRKCLKPEVEPKAEFVIRDERPIAVYAYCNLHGLWKTDIN